MACNSSSQALTSTNPQALAEKLCVTSSNSEQRDQNSSTGSLSSTHPDPGESEGTRSSTRGDGKLPKSCSFFTIARELRDMIYSDLITEGNVEILRVSRQLHDEARDILYRKGIHRMPFYIPNSGASSFIPTPPVAAASNGIQNFNIIFGHLDAPGAPHELILDIIRSFGACQGSGDCHITLLCKRHFNMYTPNEIVKFIGTLSNFKLITLRLHTEDTFHPMDSRNTAVVEPCHLEAMRILAASLSPSLGAPHWTLDTYPRSRFQIPVHTLSKWHPSPFPNAQHLVFHPRASRRSLETETGSQSLQKAW